MPRLSSPSAKKRGRPSNAIDRRPWTGWVGFRQLPIGETLVRELIDEGILESALIQRPGAKRGRRLVSTASLDAYLRSLAEEQRRKEVVVAQ